METTEDKPASAIAEYSPVAAGLADLTHRFGDVVFDCRTASGDRQAREARRELVALRGTLEDKRKALKAPALERSRLIDAEAKRIETEIRALETPIDADIKLVEQEKEAERQRKIEAHAKAMAVLRAAIAANFTTPAAQVRNGKTDVIVSAIEALTKRGTTEYGDLNFEAAESKRLALEQLHIELGLAWHRDEDAAQLARERAELELSRKAEAAAAAVQKARDDAARAAADAERARQREAEDAAAAIQREQMAKERAELDERAATIFRAETEARLAADAERDRLVREADAARDSVAAQRSLLQAAAPALLEALIEAAGTLEATVEILILDHPSTAQKCREVLVRLLTAINLATNPLTKEPAA